jgi:hypothetical protein
MIQITRNPPHASPSFGSSVCCVQKCLIEGPQHSAVRSFVPLYDPTRRPRFPSSSAPALCSLQSSLRGYTTCLPFARSPALSQTLIEGPQHSPVRSFVSAHDPTRWPRFPRSSAPALCSLHFSLRGIPLASPSHRVLLCWTLCRKDQQHSSARSFILAYNPMRRPHSPHDSAPALASPQSCLRATTTCLAFVQCSALSQALLVGTPTSLGLLHRSTRCDTAPTHSTWQRTSAQHHTTFPPPREQTTRHLQTEFNSVRWPSTQLCKLL